MQNIKNQVIKIIKKLPDNVSIDQIMEELYFKSLVDTGLRELDNGKGIPHEDVEKRISKWLNR